MTTFWGYFRVCFNVYIKKNNSRNVFLYLIWGSRKPVKYRSILFPFVVAHYLNSEKAMVPHSSTLVWKIPWAEEPGRLQSMGSRGVGHNWATSLSLLTFVHWRRKWQPTPVFLPGESQGRVRVRVRPGGLPSMGSHRVGHDWSDLAALSKLMLK